MEKLQDYMKTVAKENVQGVLAQAVEEIVREEIQKQISQRVAEQVLPSFSSRYREGFKLEADYCPCSCGRRYPPP